jgi:hypothetical protein
MLFTPHLDRDYSLLGHPGRLADWLTGGFSPPASCWAPFSNVTAWVAAPLPQTLHNNVGVSIF